MELHEVQRQLQKKEIALGTQQCDLNREKDANRRLSVQRQELLKQVACLRSANEKTAQEVHLLEREKRKAETTSAHLEAFLARSKNENASLHEQLRNRLEQMDERETVYRRECARLNAQISARPNLERKGTTSDDLLRHYSESHTRRMEESEESNDNLTNPAGELRRENERLAEMRLVSDQQSEVAALKPELEIVKHSGSSGEVLSSELREQLNALQEQLEVVQSSGTNIAQELAEAKKAMADLFEILTADTFESSPVEDWNADE
jgi:chromosome segregation ATPase